MRTRWTPHRALLAVSCATALTTTPLRRPPGHAQKEASIPVVVKQQRPTDVLAMPLPPKADDTPDIVFDTAWTERDDTRQIIEGVATAARHRGLVPPGLASSREYYKPTSLWQRNGDLNTIFAAKRRRAPEVAYDRTLLRTPDGGTLALDVVAASTTPSADKFLVLLSGLGGGSADAYVRCLAKRAVDERGYAVAVLNMRGCADAPVTSPRFFSAYRGSVDDVRLAVDWIRDAYRPLRVDGVGWSNSGTIVINGMAESEGPLFDAACALAAPLSMPTSSAYLEASWFRRNVYDRNIATGLAAKFRTARGLFEDGDGRSKPVPAWRGSQRATFVADLDKASSATSIRAVDEALTAPCFGFPSVDAYYEYSSPDQRLHLSKGPLLALNAADDPIARWDDLELLRRNVVQCDETSPVVFAVTAHGGHLGWCDPDDPSGPPTWVERVALDFLDRAAATSAGSGTTMMH